MLSRTAENLFWLGRYTERAECTVRLLEMGRRMTMLPGMEDRDEWRPILLATGVRSLTPESEPVSETEAVRTLLIDADNPSSIRSCLSHARNNGRAVRTALTQDMWEVLNDSWRRLEAMGEATACRELPEVLEWVETRTAILRGTAGNGMLRNDGYDFLRLGGYLERAEMMLRLLDVKYFVLLPETEVVGGGRDHHQWRSVLHANSAVRAYHHVYRGDYSPWKIADFLILYQDFPRSLAFSYARITDHLEKLARRYGERHSCHNTAAAMLARLSDLEMGEIFQAGLHEFILDALEKTDHLALDISRAYHF
ncbi:MAG: alpha-E domain-containing protein [Pseudomonadota bacterium]